MAEAENMFPDFDSREQSVDNLKAEVLPVWTASKAALIAYYLRGFLMVTKHGTYIDAFAGPQSTDEGWTANLVLDLEPKWLKHFALFEQEPSSVKRLQELQGHHAGRDVRVVHGDVNAELPRFLREHPIVDREATFCLFDQRTFECDWATVVTVATHKSGSKYKIELFYFLAESWIDRAIGGRRRKGGDRIEKWWGREDWRSVEKMHPITRMTTMRDRFRSELGYAYAREWAIRDKRVQGRVMYYMIHASDHPDAGRLMRAAYRRAVGPAPIGDQKELSLE